MIRLGRPKKYTKKSLAEAVEQYFATITRLITVKESYYTGKKDCDGHKIYEERPVLNSLNEEVQVIDYVIPPTVGGLCEFLGIHRSTWAEWCDPDKHPEYQDTIAVAQSRLRAWREEQLLVRKNVKGIIFDLQNNYGYCEKRQVELGERASKTIAVAGAMTLQERQALLEEIAREYQGGGASGENS